MAKFGTENRWPTSRKTPRQKDPRTQERYCHISFFDGWQQVELEEVVECNRKFLARNPVPSIAIYIHI